MYNTIKPLPIAPGCIAKTLPLAFDESLSYLEQLCSILSKLNDVIEQTNSNTDFINNWDTSLDTINKRLDDLENNYNNLKDEILEEMNRKFLLQYNELLTMINNHITQIYNYINNNNETIKQYIDEKDKEIIDLINSIIIGQIEIFNPITGQNDLISNVINDVYDTLRYNGITSNEFDTSGISAYQFDNLNLTATEFDTNSRNYIGIYNKYLNLANGTYEPLQDVLNRLFAFHQNGITITDFDGLKLTADDFDNTEITAYKFDFDNSLMI